VVAGSDVDGSIGTECRLCGRAARTTWVAGGSPSLSQGSGAADPLGGARAREGDDVVDL